MPRKNFVPVGVRRQELHVRTQQIIDKIPGIEEALGDVYSAEITAEAVRELRLGSYHLAQARVVLNKAMKRR